MSTTVRGYHGSITFDGRTVAITKRMRGETRIPVARIAEIEMGRAGIGMSYIRFATAGTGYGSKAGRSLKSHRDVAGDPEVLTFRRKRQDEFAALRAEIEAALAGVLP